jgi:hypothetical protein
MLGNGSNSKTVSSETGEIMSEEQKSSAPAAAKPAAQKQASKVEYPRWVHHKSGEAQVVQTKRNTKNSAKNGNSPQPITRKAKTWQQDET